MAAAALAGCTPERSPGPQSTFEPRPDAVLVSTSPGGGHTVQVVLAEPEEQPDGAFDVRLLDAAGAALPLESAHIDYWSNITLPDHLVAWLDGDTLLWNGRQTLDLRTGAAQSVAGTGKGTGWLDAAYSKAAGRLAEVWVGDEQLQIWMTPFDGGQPKRVNTYRFEGPGRELTASASWRGSTELYLDFPVGDVQSVVRINADGSGTAKVIEAGAYWPAVSPDGRYLAYTTPAADGTAGTSVIIDLETLDRTQDVRLRIEGLPGGHAVWSSDSKLVAVRGDDGWHVYSLAQGKVVSSIPVAARTRTLLPHFAGDKLSFAELTIKDGAVEKVEIR